ncbi:MAG: hypothetical protein ABJN40_01735 [Sneathiella sp.]
MDYTNFTRSIVLLFLVFIVSACSVKLGISGSTIAGPGTTSISAGTSKQIFKLYPESKLANVCITLLNTGNQFIGVESVGLIGTNQLMTVPPGGTVTGCSSVQSISLRCQKISNASDCTGKWRVDKLQ